MSYKIGFHTAGSGGNPTGIGDYVRRLNAVGLGASITCADGVVGIADALAGDGRTIANNLTFRIVLDGSERFAVPNYSATPYEAAIQYKNLLLPHISPMVMSNKDKIWIVLGNELDKNRSDWLGLWGYYSASIWNEAGFKVLLFGFSSGEPEPVHWRTPGMRQFLDYADAFRSSTGIALHEYSFSLDHLIEQENGSDVYYRIGRFQELFKACDEMGIGRPRVRITEFGWRQDTLPTPENALPQLKEAADLYAGYPEVDDATIWYLGPGYDKIANKAQRLIAPVIVQALHYEPPPKPPTKPPEPPEGETDEQRWWAITVQEQIANGIQWADTAIQQAILEDSFYPVTKELYVEGEPPMMAAEDLDWTKVKRPRRVYIYQDGQVRWFNDPAESEPSEEFKYSYWPAEVKYVTQHWAANPANYAQFGLPGHDGVDIRATRGSRVYAVADGTIYRVETRPDAHNYGIHVRIRHNDLERTIYAHLETALVQEGQAVQAGQVIGLADSTGNSTGDHLHFGRKVDGGYWDDHSAPNPWPYELADPTPLLKPLAPELFPDEPEPPSHHVDFGLHARADGGILPEEEFREFQETRPDIIKILSSTAESGQHPHVSRLAAEHPGARFIVRAFLDFGGRNITPQKFFDDTISDVRRSVNAISNRGNEVWIELHNEPNLIDEGWNTSWASGASFNSWLLNLLQLYRNSLPSYKYLYPGLSPGPAAPGRSPFLKWIDDSRVAAEACDGIGVHAYWNSIPDPFDMGTALADVDAIIQKFPDKPIFLTESSNNMADTPANKAAQYIEFWNHLKTRPTVRGVTYFVASASNPAYSTETWIGKGIGAMVGNR